MFDWFNVAVPASTTQAAPSLTTISLGPGTIVHAGVQFPDGCAGLVSVQILHGARQVWPTDLDEAIESDGFIIAWPESYPIHPGETVFVIRAWNDDDTYPHTVSVFFAVTPPQPEPPPSKTETLLEKLLSLFR